MGQSHRFLNCPRPKDDVVKLFERGLAAARRGDIQFAGIVVGNQLNECERESAGDLSDTRSTALIGGLSRLANDLLNSK